MTQRKISPTVWIFSLAPVAVAVVVIARWGLVSVIPPLTLMAFFLTLNVASEAFHIPMPSMLNAGNTISVTSALIIADFLFFPPFVAAGLACIGTIRMRDITGKTKLRALLFNRANIFLSALAGAELFHLVGGSSPSTGSLLAGDIVPIFVGGLAFTALNVAWIAIYMSLLYQKSLRTVWRTGISFAWANYLTNPLLALLVAASFLVLSYWGPIVFFVPLLFSRWTMARFVQLREAYLDVVSTLTSALEAKDPYTAGHSVRVSEYATQLGEYMHLSDQELDTLYFSSVLHDIGKIAIPDDILKKTGVFVTTEYMVMQQHSVIGEHIVRHLRFLGKGIQWMGQHHERWDGRGFPHRVSGRRIPIGARLISVVDTFDAMTSDRPYRKGLPEKDAYNELARVAGSQFDPSIVQAFLKMRKSELDPETWARLEAAATVEQ